MNRNLNRRIHPIAEADGLSPKKPRKKPPSERTVAFFAIYDNKDLILRISSSTKAYLLSQEHQ